MLVRIDLADAVVNGGRQAGRREQVINLLHSPEDEDFLGQ